jgi:hypothetical protein
MAETKHVSKLDELIQRANDAIEVSKKLTTKDRKSMKKSTFCGPNRSFPVPDCEHVRVAKTYLNRAKFSSSTKQKIAACINRKAKALGCPGTKPAKVKGSLSDLINSEVFETTRQLVEESKNNPDMELEFSGWDECDKCPESE